MPTTPGKRTAKQRTTLTKRVIDTLAPADKPWTAWDDKLTGFGVGILPSGAKSFIVNYRTGDGGRKAPNKRVVIGRYGKTTPNQARRLARTILSQAAGGADPIVTALLGSQWFRPRHSLQSCSRSECASPLRCRLTAGKERANSVSSVPEHSRSRGCTTNRRPV